MRIALPALLLLAAACSPPPPSDPTAPSVDAPVIDTAEPTPEPEGTLLFVDVVGYAQVSGGLVTSGSLDLGVYSTGPTTPTPSVRCEQSVPFDSADALSTSDDALTSAWEVALPDEGCDQLPATLQLGIGALPVQLWPAAERQQASVRQTRGLYARDPLTGAWVVFGIAGTAEQLDGLGASYQLDPLPDGEYELIGVYLLPL